MLRIDAHYGKSDAIEIAKGKYAISKGVKSEIEKHRRKAKMNKVNGN